MTLFQGGTKLPAWPKVSPIDGRGKWGKADYLRNSMLYLFTECLYLTKDFSIA